VKNAVESEHLLKPSVRQLRKFQVNGTKAKYVVDPFESHKSQYASWNLPEKFRINITIWTEKDGKATCTFLKRFAH
jgi:hypothetical protein